MYRIFTAKPPIPLPPIDGDDVIVHEPNLHGYRAALNWVTEHKQTTRRLIIPYSSSHVDVVDYVRSKSTEMVLGKVVSFSPQYVFQLGPVDVRVLADCVKILEDMALLRDPYSGLCAVQEYMLQHCAYGEDVCVAMAAAQFHFKPGQVREQWRAMYVGNEPPLVVSRDLDVVPRVLLNGPFPMKRDVLRELVRRFIEHGDVSGWTDVQPSCVGHTFHGHVAQSVDTGRGVKPPYGVSWDAFASANGLNPFVREFPYTALVMRTHQVEWDGTFLDARFDTVAEYALWWLNETRNRFGLEFERREDLARIREREQRFLFALYVGATVGGVPNGKRLVFDENAQSRIDQDFDGHYELLDLPIRAVCAEGVFPDQVKPLTCGRDIWLNLL